MTEGATLSRAAPSSASAPRGAARVVAGPLVGLTYVWWTLIVMEPQRFLSSMIGGPFYRLPMVMVPVLVVLLLRATGGRRVVYWPVAFITILHYASWSYAENRGFPLLYGEILVSMLLTTALVRAISDVPARLEVLLKIYLVSFVWYGIQGIPAGLVSWHHEYANEDGYGPLMTIGFAYSYCIASATSSGGWRLTGYLGAAIGSIGVVASIARGSVLAFAGTLGALWLRSAQKLRALVVGFALTGVVLIAVQALFPSGAFWDEMQSITEEGTEEGTGMVRWVMWGMAVDLWLDDPIFGVGPGNFGVVAAKTFPDDPDRPAFSHVAQIWSQQLHNGFVQILCEQGLAGSTLFLWMTISFFRRGWRLRSESRVREWRRRGGQLDLRYVSLALELGMIGFLLNLVFYNLLYIHWFWTFLALSLGLEQASRPRPGPLPGGGADIAGSPTCPDPEPALPSQRRAALGAALIHGARRQRR